MSVSTPDLSDTRAEADSASGPAATSVVPRPAPRHLDDAGSGVPAVSKLTAESSLTRRRAGDVVCVGLLVAGAILNWVVTATIPSLIGSHPVLLEALGGSEASMVVAGAFARVGRVSLALALSAPVLGLANMDPLLWWGGRRWGRSLVARLLPTGPKTERRIGRAERWFARWGGWAILAARFLPVPSPLLYAAAGWTGMALWRFVLLDLTGALAYAGLVVGLGYAIGHPRPSW